MLRQRGGHYFFFLHEEWPFRKTLCRSPTMPSLSSTTGQRINKQSNNQNLEKCPCMPKDLILGVINPPKTPYVADAVKKGERQ
jgi:hypothetical protein